MSAIPRIETAPAGDADGRPSVYAVILTFDAPEKLLQCLGAVIAQDRQPDRVLVIDNASPRSAKEVVGRSGLVSRNVEFLRLPENVGPAGGYAEGLQRFLSSRHDAAWLLDDDRVPESGCLQQLVERLGREPDPALIFPSDVDADGRAVDYPSWCGVLIPRAIVERVGIPQAAFFWWVEDTEYLKWRIPAAGFRSVRLKDAVVYHDQTVSKHRPAWKYYYETRNAVYFRVTIQGRIRIRRLRRALIRTVGRILFREKRKFHKLRMTWRGYRDGRAGRLGRTVPVPSRTESGRGGSG
jgi:rhamnopyranosyl-N-acetylglucosaminyl-diphospho-decaprenol beta-1,3/1,4-galactofuranosyltransferase